MKHVILFAAALAVCSAGSAAASSNIDDVRAELRRAVAAGEITRDEAKALMRDAIRSTAPSGTPAATPSMPSGMRARRRRPPAARRGGAEKEQAED